MSSLSIGGQPRVGQFQDKNNNKIEPKITEKTETPTKTMREEKPLTLSLGLGMPNGLFAGVDYNISKKLSLGGSAGTSLVSNDYEIHGRYYPVGGKEISLYTETGAGLVKNNMNNFFGTQFGAKYGTVLSQSIGLEYRRKDGLTINASIGKAIAVSGNSINTPTVGKIGVGYSF